MSYFGHIVPHSFLCKVSIETPAVFTHRKLASLRKIPTGIFTMCSDCLVIVKYAIALINHSNKD